MVMTDEKEKAPALSGASSSRGSKHGEGYENDKPEIKEQTSKIESFTFYNLIFNLPCQRGTGQPRKTTGSALKI